MKRTIKVPAISNKIADIPPDEYSWRKYGQKPIKGSPHPRYINITRRKHWTCSYVWFVICFLFLLFAGDTINVAVCAVVQQGSMLSDV